MAASPFSGHKDASSHHTPPHTAFIEQPLASRVLGGTPRRLQGGLSKGFKTKRVLESKAEAKMITKKGKQGGTHVTN